MKKRIIVGLSLLSIAAIIFALRLFVTPYVLDFLVLALSIGGSYEIVKMYKKNGKTVSFGASFATSVIIFAIMMVSLLLNGKLGITMLLVFVGVIVVILFTLIIKAFNLGNQKFKHFGRLSIFSCVYPNLLFMPLYFINHLTLYSNKIMSEDYIAFFFCLLIFLVAIGTDTFAFFVGRTLRGPKLAPKISPNKTISGAFGGLIGGVCAGVILYIVFNYILDLTPILMACKINFLSIIILSIILSAFSQLGDLFASYLKRKHNIKDYSNLFGEQGGFMDRFDGESFAAPICFLFILIFVI